MRENRPYGSVGGWGLIAPRLPNQSEQPCVRSAPSSPPPLSPPAKAPVAKGSQSIVEEFFISEY